MKNPADMTLEELIATRDKLTIIAGQADEVLRNAVTHLHFLDNKIAMSVGFPPKEGGEWIQSWADTTII